MVIGRVCLALLFAAALGACAELRAEAPLFSIADQAGPPPLTEGVWIGVGEQCPERNLQRRGRFPKECAPIDITRTPDGAWSARFRVDLVFGMNREERAEAEASAERVVRLVIVPAVERRLGDSYAPVYIAEIWPSEGQEHVGYAVIAPLDVLPATSMLVLSSIGCRAALRDGPIAGVAEEYRERTDEGAPVQRELSGCVASSQAAVREAARRALIEDIATLPDNRYVYVGQR